MEAGQNGAATDHVVKLVAPGEKQELEPATTQFRWMVEKSVRDSTWNIDIAKSNPALCVSIELTLNPIEAM